MSKNLKILLSVFGVLVLLGGVGGGIYLVQRNQTLQEQASPATNFSITPSTQSKNPGDTVTFAVNMDTQTNSVVAVDIDIVYDSTVLTINSIQKGSFASGFETEVPGNNTTAGHYKYHVATQDSTKALHGAGDIAVISATIKSDAPSGVTNLSFGSSTIAAGIGEGGVNVLVGKSGAQLTIAGVTPSIAPSIVPSIVPSVAPSIAPSVAPSIVPSVAPSIVPTPGNGGTASTAPSPSTVASSAPAASTVASSAPASSSAPAATPTASTKPTVTIPTSGTIAAGTTISGTAAPNSTVTIVIHSNTITATVKADSTGKWSYKMPATLENGSHTISITDSKGTTTKSFKLTGGVEATASATQLPATGASIPTIFGISLGVMLLVAGLVLAL